LVSPCREGAHNQAANEDLVVAFCTETPFPDNFTDTAHDSDDNDLIMPPDDENNNNADHSNFSTTHAAAEEVLRLKKQMMTDKGWVATMDTHEEDINLEEEYLEDVVKSKGKGKAAAVELSDDKENPSPVASDDDEDQDEDKTPNGYITPWEVALGVLSSVHLKEATYKAAQINCGPNFL
jgi:hypothetical protein